MHLHQTGGIEQSFAYLNIPLLHKKQKGQPNKQKLQKTLFFDQSDLISKTSKDVKNIIKQSLVKQEQQIYRIKLCYWSKSDDSCSWISFSRHNAILSEGNSTMQNTFYQTQSWKIPKKYSSKLLPDFNYSPFSSATH